MEPAFSDVWEICIYVQTNGWQNTDLSSVAGGPAPAGCDGGCVAKTDFDIWAAQCCWLSVSRCRAEALESVGKCVRTPAGRKYILDFFKREKSIAVHANLGQYPGKEL